MMWTLILWAMIIVVAFMVAELILTLGIGVIVAVFSGIGAGFVWLFKKMKGGKK